MDHESSSNLNKHLQRAQLLIEVNRWREALLELNQHLALCPDDYNGLCQSALCHYRLREFQRAYDRTKTAIANSPESEWAYRLQSLVFSANGESKRALDAARVCVEKSPWLFASLQTLFYAQADYGLLDEAESTLALLLRSNPAKQDGQVASGFLALKNRDWANAEHHFLEALKLDPMCVNALNNLGVVYLERSKKGGRGARDLRQRSVEMFERALKTDPTYKTAQNNIRTAGSSVKRVGVSGAVFAILFYVLIGPLTNLLYNFGKRDFSDIRGTLSDFSPISESALINYSNFYSLLIVPFFLLGLIRYLWSEDFRARFLEKTNLPAYWGFVTLWSSTPLLLYAYAFFVEGIELPLFSLIMIRVISVLVFISVIRFIVLVHANRSQN